MSLINCASQKQKTNFDEIIYESITRGRSEKITIKEHTVYYKTHLKSSTYKLTKNQQELLDKEISNLNLKGLSTLKAPTNKRLFDGAMHTNIFIKKDSKQYVSSTFDDTNPPAELIALCTFIKNLIRD